MKFVMFLVVLVVASIPLADAALICDAKGCRYQSSFLELIFNRSSTITNQIVQSTTQVPSTTKLSTPAKTPLALQLPINTTRFPRTTTKHFTTTARTTTKAFSTAQSTTTTKSFTSTKSPTTSNPTTTTQIQTTSTTSASTSSPMTSNCFSTTQDSTTEDPLTSCDINKSLMLLSTDGTYLKSACLLAIPLNYSEASFRCQQKGMKLLELSSKDVTDALFIEALANFPAGAGSTLWINGLTTVQCTMMDNAEGQFRIANKTCDTRMFSYCEYFKSPTREEKTARSCILIQELVEPFIKKAKKTTCYQNLALTHEEAVQRCQSAGFKLFQVTNDLQNMLFKYSESIFGRSSNATVWIDSPQTGPCVMESNAAGAFSIYSEQCSRRMGSFCEM